MSGIIILATIWFGSGVLGWRLAVRGSMRDYGKNIYRWWEGALTIVFGLGGFFGSMVAW